MKQKKTLFFRARSPRLAKKISITSPSTFRKSIRALKQKGLTLRERRALVLAQNRAKAQLKRKNLSVKERKQFLQISRIRMPKLKGGAKLARKKTRKARKRKTVKRRTKRKKGGWYGQPKKHRLAALKALKTKGLKPRKYKKTARGLKADRLHKAKHTRHAWQPRWRGDLPGEMV